MQAAPYGAGRAEPSCFPKNGFQADLKLNLCQDPPPIRQAPRQEVLPLGVDAVLLWLRKRVKRTLLRISFAMLLNHNPFLVRHGQAVVTPDPMTSIRRLARIVVSILLLAFVGSPGGQPNTMATLFSPV
jgi:hypothetical protein